MKSRVLFVCYGNTCRSVIAEHTARQKFEESLDPASAGFYPQTPHDTIHALDALRSFGIDVPRHQPRDVRFTARHSFDRVVTMDPEVHRLFREAFPAFPTTKIVEWNVDDPWDNPASYKACVEKIFTELGILVGRLDLL